MKLALCTWLPPESIQARPWLMDAEELTTWVHAANAGGMINTLRLAHALSVSGCEIIPVTQIDQAYGQFDGIISRWTRLASGIIGTAGQAAMILEQRGIPVWNSATSMLLASDKASSDNLFIAAGLLCPQTFSCSYDANIELQQLPDWDTYVCKPMYGSAGEGIVTRNTRTETLEYVQRTLNDYGVIIQERIRPQFAWRVIASPSQIFGYYVRTGDPHKIVWSLHHGAQLHFDYNPPSGLAAIAMTMCAAVGADMMGCDILQDKDGKLWALEINGCFGFGPLMPDIVEIIADNVIDTIAQQ